MNAIDLLAALVLALAALVGFRSGALPQLGGLGGAVLGLVAALWVLPGALVPLASVDPLIRALLVFTGLVLAVGVGEVAGARAGMALGRALGDGLLGATEKLVGSAVGVVQGVLVVWLVVGLLVVSPFARLAEQASSSMASRLTGLLLPPPPEVAGDLARALEDTGLPDVFVGLEPFPAPPVERPSDPEVARIGAAAEASTPKVSSNACGTVLVGSGVVVADGYVVTNAHVVAGSSTTRLRLGDATVDAVPVLFDPALDVALLHAPGLDAPALRFAASDPDRGAQGATLGYPGGGGLVVEAAAVTRRMTANGRDIYDAALVSREILELRATVDRGDSGGPFVLADGTVGGLVFAEAKRDASVGYALAPTDVAVAITPGLGRTGAVDTGPCTR